MLKYSKYPHNKSRYRFRTCWSLVEWHSFLCKLSGTADIRFVSCFGMNLFLCAGGKKEMKLNKKNMVVISFMLFSLFFGAGNLIFPPFLGQNAGEHTFTAILIYLSIGPGLSIPRAASVPFEMTVSPYLPNDANHTLWMVLYSALFFLVALWLCLNPGKLVQRIGRVLTPSLLILLVLLFISFVTKGNVNGTSY